MKLSGLQKPTQHSESTVHASPAALHIVPRQSPMLQVPSQQSAFSLQVPPVTEQLGPRQMKAVQVEPMQQSVVSTQFAPGPAQVAVPTQRPEMQLFEQQRDALVQPSPIGAQPQTPLRHWPSQQSVLNRHASPAGLQGSRQSPSWQVPSQHSASAPQGWRSFVHSGGGGVTVLQAERMSARPRARECTPAPYAFGWTACPPQIKLPVMRVVVVAVVAVFLSSCLGNGKLLWVRNKRVEPAPNVERLRAGVAEVDLTPPPGLPTYGFSSDGAAHTEGYWLRLQGRVIVLESGTTRIAMMQLDLGAASALLHRKIAERIERLGIAAPQLVMSTTHTHGGPSAFFSDKFFNNVVGAAAAFDERLVD